MDDDEPPIWEKLVDKEFQDVFFDTEGEGGDRESPEEKNRERRLDKRREFGLGNKMSKKCKLH